MKWFLGLVILLMCGGGYYEYQVLHGQIMVDELQISDLNTKLQSASAAEQKAISDLAQLKASLAGAPGKSDNPATQPQFAKTTGPQNPAPLPSATSPGGNSSSPSAASVVPGTLATNLGTINAIDGKVYPNCQLLKINTDNIVISNAQGITQIEMSVLPANLQKMFGFDPKVGVLSNDQVQALEQQQRQGTFAIGK